MRCVDSDVFIDLLRGEEKAAEFFVRNRENICFCAITEAELLSGNKCRSSQEKENVLHLLAGFEKIPVDNPAVIIAGNLRREIGVPLPDAMIAACAIEKGCDLVTRNVKDFQRIPGLRVVKPY